MSTTVIEQYFDRLNRDDWGALASVWQDEAELRAVGGFEAHGREAVLAYYERILAGYREHHDEVTRLVSADPTFVAEIHFTGVTAAGNAVVFDAVDVFDVRHGLIASLSSWYDSALVNRLVRGGRR